MKLWLISQSENDGYDCYDSAIVAAETEDDAKNINPDSPDGRWPGKEHRNSGTWCSSPDNVTVKLIGDGLPDQKPGVILGSFNAG